MVDLDIDEEISTMLKSADQRYTTGRKRVTAVLATAPGPLTMSQILAADTALSQSSVYRNLTVLEEVGAVTRIVTGDDFSRYELAEHLTAHHHHLICNDCGDVIDFELDDKTESALDNSLHRAAASEGFVVANHRLDLFGTCGECG